MNRLIRKAIVILALFICNYYLICLITYVNLPGFKIELGDQNRDFGVVYNELDKNRFYVIVNVFNPASFNSRYESYWKFEKHIKTFGVKLITVELAFNDQDFKITSANNTYHIQLRTDDVLWYKENLINIAIKRLPKECRWVAWVDMEVEFLNKDWVIDTMYALDKYKLVQAFEIVRILGPTQKIIEAHAGFAWCNTVNQLNLKDLPYSVLKLKYSETHAYFKWLKNEMYCTTGYGEILFLIGFAILKSYLYIDNFSVGF
jgi:hypothetical protein